MKRRTAFSLSVLTLSAVFLLLASTGLQAASTISVDCTTDSLQTALNSATAGSTINVTGTCNESIIIRPNGLTLDGGGTAVLNGPLITMTVVSVAYASGVTIKGFTITGGYDTVQLVGGNTIITNNTIQDSARYGIIAVEGGTAIVLNNTVQNAASHGIVLTDDANGRIGFNRVWETVASTNTIQNNGGYGISVTRSSSGRIVGNTISGNALGGISISKVSHADVTDNDITGNLAEGISVKGNSGLSLGVAGGTDIFSLSNKSTVKNSGMGIVCNTNSYVEGRRGTLSGKKGNFKSATDCVSVMVP